MDVNKIIKALLSELDENGNKRPMVPLETVNKILHTHAYYDHRHGQEAERREIVCRLLASGMPADEISVILELRVAEILEIETTYGDEKIPDYAIKLAARRKSRAKSKR